ncbi:cob(I)yrinic acid a,c-diamide adenosyltransferase [Cellulomonas telluris]|uniref:cob(I)yrinic acid a,c-diamide adenosyltransferase n=1 Tax=Cellulomonas telluris TaxID=2306636 RepID=UPI0010A778CB|nr:cob(I)yrinic acid a,c-diamide adenosyltransferase [Cellulomonas telluris]
MTAGERGLVRLTRIRTGTGDDGSTQLSGGARVAKSDARVELLGVLDELNATTGVARTLVPATDTDLDAWLLSVQHDLFDLGADVSHPDVVGPRGTVGDPQLEWLDDVREHVNATLPTLTSFVLPGGTALAAQLHVCRTVCRRAERRVAALVPGPSAPLAYLNRLSDLFFVLARRSAASEEVTWTPTRRRPAPAPGPVPDGPPTADPT